MGALTGMDGTASAGEVAAVLSALAGVRKGDAVAAVGAGRITKACLSAGAGLPLLDEGLAAEASARVVVVEKAYEVQGAVRLLAPGGRFVAIAANRGMAQRASAALGLELRHVEALGTQVAWSAVRPVGP